MDAISLRTGLLGVCLLAGAVMAAPAHADNDDDDEAYHDDYVYGTPDEPTEAWLLTRGGRLYDNWYASQDLDSPEGTHPAWPASNPRTGSTTWRCKSCHGWDYRGADGQYGSGSYQTGIAGVTGYSGSATDLEALLRADPHGFTEEMIPSRQAGYLAAFLDRGLDDMNAVIDPGSGEVSGDPARGAEMFQTICAACHGFDGRALDWGDGDEPGYVGTEANANPWEVLHKIRNGHPGVEMVALRAFDLQDAVDLLAHTRTLPAR